ncbi:M23 family metallopeptidase [Clostridium sp. D2Q-11]|uniref:M23 family metallopeptidase n=1 Tax=Anaeromonas frigoriresistens TaxID=2683708 RepID=A0A942Z6C0_9FIRM|nr:M23 family metallopeptidase [Anaeromonas frigoriresistens]
MDKFNKDPNNDKGPKKNKDKKSVMNRMKNVTQRDGFYLVLFLCICIVGITAVWVSSDNFNKVADLDEKENELAEDDRDIVDYYLDGDDYDDQQDPDTEDVDIEETDKAKEETKEEAKANTEEQKSTDEEAIEATSSQGKQLAMLVPIMGKQSMGFAEDKLVYSETLEQWTTHNGLDIQAAEGSAVRAVLSGVVKEVVTTDELGIVVTIDHSDGLQTKYGCLSTDEMVEAGQQIEKGDPIGAVGKSVGYELAQGPHLHFEVLEAGKNIDPKNYLPDFE